MTTVAPFGGLLPRKTFTAGGQPVNVVKRGGDPDQDPLPLARSLTSMDYISDHENLIDYRPAING